MKKRRLGFLLMLIVISLCGCANESEHLSLRICGAYAVPGMFHSDLKGTEMEYEVKETDSYGRTLFLFTADHYVTGQRESALVICQKYDTNYVYYYEDVCYLFGEYSQEEVDALKEKNDWGKELDTEKMSRRSNKSTIDLFIVTGNEMDHEEVIKACRNKFSLDAEQEIQWYFWDMDASGKCLAYITFVRSGETERHVVIVTPDYKVFAFAPTDVVSADELAEFKHSKEWDYGF